MDWLKGQFTEAPIFYSEDNGFLYIDFPFNQLSES